MAVLLACGICAFRYVDEELVPERAPIPPAASVGIPVPAGPVMAGMRGGEIETSTLLLAQDAIPPGALVSLEPIRDSYALSAMPAGQPMFLSGFTERPLAGNPVIERIPPGMRAMTVQVDATAAVEGWAGSGSVVDVLLVESGQTSVVAEQVTVLSAERSVLPIERASAPSVPSTLTLLVSQEQCLAINTAIPLGKLSFALRGMADEQSWASTRLSASAVGGRDPAGKRAQIDGYASLQEGGEVRRYVLSQGKWLRSPEVFQDALAESGAQRGPR